MTVENGAEMYVEPTTMASARSRTLVAGWPSYLFARGPDSKPRQISSEHVLGALVDELGAARTVESPVASDRVGGVRALGRDDERWDIVYAELIPFPKDRFPQPDTAARLWHGVHDGRRWTSLEEIPRPGGFIFHPKLGTRLVRSGGTLAWALRATNADGRINVVVFSRRDGKWTSEVIPTPSASYIELTQARAPEFLLAVVRADTSLRPGDNNSLFIYARDPHWRPVRRVARGGREPTNHPSFLLSNAQLVLTWYVDKPGGGEVRMLRDPLHAPLTETQTLDSAFTGGRPVASAVLHTRSHWIINHSKRGQNGAELRIVRDSGREVREVARWPSPFVAGVRATAVQGSGLLLAGAIWDPRDSIPVSLLLRVRVECKPSAYEAGTVR